MVCIEVPATLAFDEVCRKCREETARYRRREPHDDRYCYDVIRRAVVEGDNACWETLMELYGDLLLVWCRKAVAHLPTDAEELVALTWEKFLVSFTPAKFAVASGTGGVLRYLQMCAHSVSIDQARARAATVPYDDAIAEPEGGVPSPDDILADHAGRLAFWKLISEHLRTEQEREFIRLGCELDMKSAEIQSLRPDLFPSVKDVYRVSRNLMDRLGRSQKLRVWYEDERG